MSSRPREPARRSGRRCAPPAGGIASQKSRPRAGRPVDQVPLHLWPSLGRRDRPHVPSRSEPVSGSPSGRKSSCSPMQSRTAGLTRTAVQLVGPEREEPRHMHRPRAAQLPTHRTFLSRCRREASGADVLHSPRSEDSRCRSQGREMARVRPAGHRTPPRPSAASRSALPTPLNDASRTWWDCARAEARGGALWRPSERTLARTPHLRLKRRVPDAVRRLGSPRRELR